MIYLRALLFDFDGLLVDSEPLHFLGFRDVAREVGVDLDEAAYYRDYVGLDDRDGFRRICADAGRPIDDTTLARLMDRKARLLDEHMRRELIIRPGAVDFVRRAAEIFAIGVCSGALRHEVLLGLEVMGVRECMLDVVAADDVARAKPDPTGYRLLVERLSAHVVATGDPPLDVGLCAVLEDTTTGLAAGRGAGCWTVGVVGSEPPERLRRSAHLVLDKLAGVDPADLAALLGQAVGPVAGTP